jgi:hypothetical protein
MAKELLTTEHIARNLRVVPTTILLVVECRNLPCIRCSTRAIRFDPAAEDRWLQQKGGVE